MPSNQLGNQAAPSMLSKMAVRRRRQLSLLLLLAGNLLPLAGVLLLDWDVAALLILYWSENLILGFYTLLRMLVVSPLGGLGMGAFFCLHYGGFCAVHGLFLLALLLDIDIDMDPITGDLWAFFLVFVQMLFNVVRAVLEQAPTEWLYAFAALFISHGASFLLNFIVGGERHTATLAKLMTAPYNRIILLHCAIIAGGAAVIALGQPLLMLVALIALKILLDVWLHSRERKKLSAH